MRYCLSLFHSRHKALISEFFDEILLHTDIFSKVGTITISELDELFALYGDSKRKITLVWDTLLSDDELSESFDRFATIPLEYISAVRFMDPGVGHCLRQRFPELPLQITLERNSHNQRAIKEWIAAFSPQLERVILSNEIPYRQLASYRDTLLAETEFLAIGRLEIFNTPRKLLSPVISNFREKEIISVYNLERPSALGAGALQNRRGTFLFHEQDVCILDVFPFTEERHAIDWMRFDFYADEHFRIFQDICEQEQWPLLLKQRWPNKSNPGYFRVNKTDAQFKRLKNRHLEKVGKKIGDVLEYKKGALSVVRFVRQVNLPEELVFLSPDGHEASLWLYKAEDLSGRQFDRMLPPGLYRIPRVKGATAKSKIATKSNYDSYRGN